MKKFIKFAAIALLAAGMTGCEKNKEEKQSVTGIIIGSYSSGGASLIVQVDKKYPIGRTLETPDRLGNACLFLPENQIFQNVIQVQPYIYMLLSDFPETETIINKRIAFTYREYRYGEEDAALFDSDRIGNAMCRFPDIPMYVITDCQIIN